MCRLCMKETTNISQSELFKNKKENWYKKYNKNHITRYTSYIESYTLACKGTLSGTTTLHSSNPHSGLPTNDVKVESLNKPDK